jgi:hypothetical protein
MFQLLSYTITALSQVLMGNLISRSLVVLFLILGSFPGGINAQTAGATPQDKTIDAKTQLEIIDSVSQALNKSYIFADIAKKMEKHIRQQYNNKIYKELTSTRDFTQKLTEDLREISKDRHLGVMFASDQLLARMEGDTLTDEGKKQELEENRRDNFCFKEVKQLPGNVGYIDFRCFANAREAGPTAIGAMNFLAYTDAIIFDLRENGGGDASMIQLLSSYLFWEPIHLTSWYQREIDSTIQSWTPAFVQGPRMTETDVYVLTSSYTFSAAEEFAYNLKNLKRATVVGEITGGGAHTVKRVPFKNLNVGIQIPFGRAINPVTGTNWEGTGITPDIQVPKEKALDVAYLKALEKILEKTKEPRKQFQIKWVIEGKNAALNPVTLTESEMQKYVGQYGPRKIFLENGQLYYQREPNPKFKLIPMGNHKFMLEGLDYFRIQFLTDEQGEVIELVGQYDDGRTDSNKRAK